MASFESVAPQYDLARPSYPSGVYDLLEPLDGVRALDVGAGTGIATRQLASRGARVVAVDRGPLVLAHAVARAPGLRAVVADGAALPVRRGAVDLVCFAQSWHWLDPTTRCAEVHRVLGDGGRWAGWWSHARADSEDWFDRYWSAVERSCPGTHRGQRDIDWGATVAESRLFDVGDRMVVRWTREVGIDEWMTDQASHSYVVGLAEPARERLLCDLRDILDRQFAGTTMRVPYETWLWIGRRVARNGD